MSSAHFDHAQPVAVAVGSWDAAGREARSIREAVFVVEQGIPVDLEWDEWDARSVHALARDPSGRVLGTGRLLPREFDPGAPATAHIGRMAVLVAARRAGVGGLVLRALMDAARERGFTEVVLHAQSYVAPFYARHGYVAEGEEFMEAGIAHVTMRCAL